MPKGAVLIMLPEDNEAQKRTIGRPPSCSRSRDIKSQ